MRFSLMWINCLLLLFKVVISDLACRHVQSSEALAEAVHVDIKLSLGLNLEVFVFVGPRLMRVLSHAGKEVLGLIYCLQNLLWFEALKHLID